MVTCSYHMIGVRFRKVPQNNYLDKLCCLQLSKDSFKNIECTS